MSTGIVMRPPLRKFLQIFLSSYLTILFFLPRTRKAIYAFVHGVQDEGEPARRIYSLCCVANDEKARSPVLREGTRAPLFPRRQSTLLFHTGDFVQPISC